MYFKISIGLKAMTSKAISGMRDALQNINRV